ncbi:transmembrane protein 182-like [Spea bombifrons]|uniref:transmembrane protein 182-like n=1 Tax=Spea bombifrons TaxID=233779 RepID=UPI00234AC481|nr:transmembrane protein 182-like [Spea bombifrons]
MKVGIAALVAGFFGGIGVLLFFTAFGTDYWLLATENCGTIDGGLAKAENVSDPRIPTLYFHHEGFFWRCWFNGNEFEETIWNFWFTSQAHQKHCINGYLFPMPLPSGLVPHPSYDPTAVYRGFWTAFIILAVAASLVGGLLLVCAVPFTAARLYKVGGGFLITAGVLLASLILLFAMWKEFAADLEKYILLERSQNCLPDTHVHVYYGWSFMFAAAGTPLVLLSGLLFLCIGRNIGLEEK